MCNLVGVCHCVILDKIGAAYDTNRHSLFGASTLKLRYPPPCPMQFWSFEGDALVYISFAFVYISFLFVYNSIALVYISSA